MGEKGEHGHSIRGDMKVAGGPAGQCRSLTGKPVIHMEEGGASTLHRVIPVNQHGGAEDHA